MSPTRRLETFIQGVFFVAGFGVFVIGVLGLIGTLLGDLLYDARDVMRYIGGALLIAFGLFTLGVLKIPFLYADTRRSLSGTGRRVGAMQSFLTGVSFAAGWSPCIGPFLGAILSMSVDAGELSTRLVLLSAYVLGLGIPFLAVALLADRAAPALARLKRHMHTFEIISGLLLIAIGVVMIAGGLSELSRYFSGFENRVEAAVLGYGDGNAPTIIVAWLAGLLSFASPCVLPLVPAYIGYISGWAITTARES